jgi:sec-independent protein translocase protein TatA
MPGWIGFPELVLLLLVLLLIFGPKRLPEMGRSLGKGMREFKDSITSKDDGSAPSELEPPVGTQDTSAPSAARERDAV